MGVFLLVTFFSGMFINLAEAPMYAYRPGIVEESKALALQISKLRQSHDLEYKDINDLNETALIICQNATDKFDKYDIAAIVLKESRYNHMALNKKDGSKGLMQVLAFWRKSIPWYEDPYNKHQSIKAGVYVLHAMYSKHKEKNKAIVHYNGSSKAAYEYQKHIAKLKNEIKSVKI